MKNHPSIKEDMKLIIFSLKAFIKTITHEKNKHFLLYEENLNPSQLNKLEEHKENLEKL